MVSYAPLTVTVHDSPAHRVRAILAVVEDFDLSDGPPPDESCSGDRALLLGVPYAESAVRLGADDEVAERLQRYAPDACWTVQQDPRYEHPGMLHVHVPGLGTYVATCDTYGQPTPRLDLVRAALGDPAALRELFGLDHLDAAAALNRAGVAVTGPARFTVFWRQRSGQGWIELDGGAAVTFTGPASPVGQTPGFEQLDPALFRAGWAVLGCWSSYNAGGIWTTEVSRIEQPPAAIPASASPRGEIPGPSRRPIIGATSSN